MDADELKRLAETGAWEQLESAWPEAVESDLPLAVLAEVLQAAAAGGQRETAEMLAWTLLELRKGRGPAGEPLAVARAALEAAPDSEQLRGDAAELYRSAYGEHEHFEAILKASGLTGGQTARRALATLDACLAIRPGSYVVSRYDEEVLRVEGYDPALGEFRLTDPRGQPHHREPKRLADDFRPADEIDFRVLDGHRREELSRLLEADPGAVLLGVCLAHGGRTDSSALKRTLVPRHLPPEKWVRWWTRARAAAKKSPRLSLHGRNPTEIAYYPQGRSLEEELAAPAGVARTVPERLGVLQQYARAARQRKRPLDLAFTAPILNALAAQARASGAEALAAALAVRSAAELGIEPPGGCPAPEEVLAAAREPARAVAAVDDPALWPAALDALAARPDADRHLRRLLQLAPAEGLDDVAARLRQAGAGEAVAAAAAQAAAEPSAHRELLLWLWRGPGEAVPGAPGPVELLGKVLDVLGEVDRSVSLAAGERTRLRQRIRAALSARDYAGCRRAVAEMDEAVAETYRDRIGRCGGLAQTVREEMLGVLRERFGRLFVQAPVEPWRDERTLWTTQAALHRREELLKDIVEVKMPANARAIGAAAAHGDLSENSEWKFAIEERDLLRARAARLQDDILRARVLTAEDVPDERVGIGSRVRLRREDDGREVTVTVLGAWDTDLERNVFSYKAAVSEELLGKGVGDPVALKLEGLEGQYRIAELGCGVE